MATTASNATTTQTEDLHAKTLDPSAPTAEDVTTEKSPASSTDRKDGDAGETKSKTTDPATVTADNSSDDGASVTDIQRKMRRAERFGMPVQLSEEEKRNSRAERFGTTPGSQATGATKKAEDLKRKARAERFGIKETTSAEEEEKKKARLSRFGSASSTATADPLEEQKKQARALRFSGTQANGNGKLEQKATVAGKAGGEA